MSTGLSSLAGYGSDSDDEDALSASPILVASDSSTAVFNPPTAASNKPSSSWLGTLLPPPQFALASKLPPSTSSSSTFKSASGLSLPPPTASTKRKVIKVDSLQAFKDSEDGQHSDKDGRNGSDNKKPKLGSSLEGPSSTRHSLFGMLPAPKRKDDEVLAERKREAQARKAEKAVHDSDTPALTEAPLRIDEDAAHGSSPEAQDILGNERGTSSEATNTKSKGKNNDAFRAMLGLKPAANKQPTHAPPTSASASNETSATISSQNANLPQPSVALHKVINLGAAAASSRVEPAPVDFFALNSARSQTDAGSSTHKPSFSVSAAPIIDLSATRSHREQVELADNDDDATDYPGWQLDPDGSWVPVTPEAHAQLLAYQQSLSSISSNPANTSTSRGAANLDGTRDLLAAGLTPEDIRAFDASSAARDAYPESGGGDEADSDKYAAVAEFAAGNREVQQRKPGMLKGLRKGQLSSLISLANENRSKFEQRWQKGRDAHTRRSNQYGF